MGLLRRCVTWLLGWTRSWLKLAVAKKICIGFADLEQDTNTNQRMWTTYYFKDGEVLNMDFGQGLAFDPKQWPAGTHIRIYVPRG